MIEYRFLLLTTAGDRWRTAVNSMTDITDYVLLEDGLQIEVGRTSEREAITPSICSFSLINEDNRFDPTDASGPYYGFLNLNQPMAVQVKDGATWSTIFYGYVASGFPVTISSDKVRTVPISCVDSLGLLNNIKPLPNLYERVITHPESAGNTYRTHWFPLDSQYARNWLADGEFAEGAPLVVGNSAGSLTFKGGSVMVYEGELIPTTFVKGSLEFWFKIKPPEYEDPATTVLFSQTEKGTEWYDSQNMLVTANPYGITFKFRRGYDYYIYSLEGVNTVDNAAHHLVLSWSLTDSENELWLDGKKQNPSLWKAVVGTLPMTGNTILGNTYSFDESDEYSLQHLQTYSERLDETAIQERYEAGARGKTDLPVRNHMFAQLQFLGSGLDRILVDYDGVSNDRPIYYPISDEDCSSYLELLGVYERTVQGVVWSTPLDNGSQISIANAFQFSQGAPVWALADDGTGKPFLADSFVAGYDALKVENVASVTRKGGITQYATNSDSVSAIGERTLDSLEGLLVGTDHEALNIAQWRTYVYSQPSFSVEDVAISATTVTDVKTLLTKPTALVRITYEGRTFYGHFVGASLVSDGARTIIRYKLSGVRYLPNAAVWGDDWNAATWI